MKFFLKCLLYLLDEFAFDISCTELNKLIKTQEDQNAANLGIIEFKRKKIKC